MTTHFGLLCLIGSCSVAFGGFMTLPDYESAWTDIASSTESATSYKEFVHGLGEVPLLVDVQVKAIDGDNRGYIFQATGHQQRDDDAPEDYGGVIYIYSAKSVRVSAPLKGNDNLGRTIYTGASPYWAGPYAQDSWSAMVRVRCWRESSLPKPDFKSTGTTIKSTTGLATDSYKKISHGINGTPNLVVSRIQFDLAGTIMYADSVGSAGVVYIGAAYSTNGYVVFGYDSSNIQVWTPSDTSGRLVSMGDGYAISGEATQAELQLYAWSSQTLPYNTSGNLKLSSIQKGSEKILDYKSAGNENQVFTRSWIQSATGPSSGYMFPGTGSLSYSTTANDDPCSYGGMVYAYTNQSVRYWQPIHAYGAMVCIASCLGTKINNQAVNEGTAVLYSWELDINECRTNPCKNGATCENYFNSYGCKCAPGFAGTHCENNIDECIGHQCKNGATCVDKINEYTCTCVAGYDGKMCENNINECASHLCKNGATCVDQVNGYVCTCQPGYNGKYCETDVNECATHTCQNGATCVDKVNGYNCTCVAGYDGTYCNNNINDCASHKCLNGASCTDGVNTYSCTCAPGYNGKLCEVDINECANNQCKNGATCVDKVNGYTCNCILGYDGKYCENNVNECATNTCQNGATCVDKVNGYTCTCVAGYDGTYCNNNINDCASHKCQNGAACIDGVNTYSCKCAPGYNGNLCESDINECATHTCQNGATCVDKVNEYTCTCVAGYDGTYCNNNINDCASHKCLNGASCIDGVNEYSCTCASGYNGTLCDSDINECVNNQCKNGATCVDKVNGYTCTCIQGFDGKFCENNINECASHKCQNGGSCIDGVDKYSCTCAPGYNGTLCADGSDENGEWAKCDGKCKNSASGLYDNSAGLIVLLATSVYMLVFM